MKSLALDFPGVVARFTAGNPGRALVLRSERPLQTLSSALVGGGFGQARCIINRHVDKDYDVRTPAEDLIAFAREHGVDEPFVGLMTAVYVDEAESATARDGDLTVATVATAGVGNATASGLSGPAALAPGTINLVVLVDGALTPAALVNAVITATEAKTQTLMDHGVRTSDGHPASGTSTDAVVIACTGRGPKLPYAGPATRVGWLIGRSVRRALEKAL
jgi:iron complex transport system ATP-binding protein